MNFGMMNTALFLMQNSMLQTQMITSHNQRTRMMRNTGLQNKIQHNAKNNNLGNIKRIGM